MFLFLMSYLLKTVQRYKIIINLQAFSRKISQNDSIFLCFLSFCRGFIPKSANFPHISVLSNHLSSLFRSIQLSSFIFSVYPAIFLHFFYYIRTKSGMNIWRFQIKSLTLHS